MKRVRITRPGRFGKFEGRLMRSQHLDAGAEVDYPDHYAISLIESGWAVEVKAENKADPTPAFEVPGAGSIPVGHPFLDIPLLRTNQALALRSAGYKTLDDLASASDDDLLAIAGIGEATLVHIRRYLRLW